jgi:hypothetical protein
MVVLIRGIITRNPSLLPAGEIQGIPSLPKLQSDVDRLQSGLSKVHTELGDLKHKSANDIAAEKGAVSVDKE